MTIFERLDALETLTGNLSNEIVELEEKLTDSGWIDLPLLNGAVAYSDNLRPQCRKIGKQVFLRGVVKNITSSNFVFAQLPEAFRTNMQSFFIGSSIALAGKATFYTCQISVDGTIRVNNSSSGEYNAANYVRLTTSFLVD